MPSPYRMAQEYIQERWGITVKRGMRIVTPQGQYGTVKHLAGSYVHIRLDGETTTLPYHPTSITYLEKNAS